MEANNTYGIKATLDELVKLRLQVVRHPKRSKRPRSQNLLAGESSSRLLGRGMDFAEFRIYQPGNDDIRCIDWNVTARTGITHVRVHQQEKERPVFIIVDQSLSMQFATRIAFKSVLAARLAALLAWQANMQGDRIGGMICGVGKRLEVRPEGGKRGVLRLLKQLASNVTPIEQVDWQETFLHLRRVIRPGSLVYILSDFYNMDEQAQKHLHAVAQHNEIILGWISDPLEQSAPPPNLYTFSDGRKKIKLDTSDRALCKRYARMFLQRQKNLVALCQRYRLYGVPITTAQPATEYLSELLQPKHYGLDTSLTPTAA